MYLFNFRQHNLCLLCIWDNRYKYPCYILDLQKILVSVASNGFRFDRAHAVQQLNLRLCNDIYIEHNRFD